MTKAWRRLLSILIFLAALFPGSQASAQESAPPLDPAEVVDFEQRLNVQIPLQAEFRDERGAPVKLGEYFGGKPVILQFAYYDCPMLCNLVFSNLAHDLKSLGLTPGQDYEVVTISISPRETPELAAAKKAAFLNDSALHNAEDHWHFLTGQEAQIQAVTSIAGFRYAYDAALGQYAHPAGLIILTPDGKTSKYLLGLDYAKNGLRLALVEASQRKIGTVVDQFYLLCYRYNPTTGKYTLLVNRLLKWAGAAMVLALAGFVAVLRLQEVRSRRKRALAAEESRSHSSTPYG